MIIMAPKDAWTLIRKHKRPNLKTLDMNRLIVGACVLLCTSPVLAGPPPIPPQQIPALGQYGLMASVALIAMYAGRKLGKKRDK